MRQAWAHPRYAGTAARWFWRLFVRFIAASAVWPFVAFFMLDQHGDAWMLLIAPEVVLLLGIAVRLIYRTRVQREVLKHRDPICPGCGYRVQDLPACPECGLAMSPNERKQAWHDAGYTLP